MNKFMIRSTTVVASLGLLLVALPSRAEETRTLTNLRGERVIVPDLVPERGKLAPLGTLVIEVETPIGKGGLILAFYDDPNSQRLGDYVEVSDLAGNLLKIEWYDENGQVSVAYDQNLTDPNAQGPAKVLVIDAEHRFVIQSPPLRRF